MSEGFFSRWSRRKQETAAEQPLLPQPQAPAPVTAVAAEPAVQSATKSTEPLPTLDEARALTPESDFQPFMQRGVGAEVRNAAMKKLFTDPHFNVMDGLDIYIDDYNRPDPMPQGMLQKMASAQFLKLVPQDSEVSDPQVVAQSPDSSAKAEPTPHDHPDLQLQPDSAPADPRPGSGDR